MSSQQQLLFFKKKNKILFHFFDKIRGLIYNFDFYCKEMAT